MLRPAIRSAVRGGLRSAVFPPPWWATDEPTDPLLALIDTLFGQGEQGAMYVPRPVVLGQQALYQDAAGSAPVTADGDPVGLMKDVSGNGNHATQSVSAARMTLHDSQYLRPDGSDDNISIPIGSGFVGDFALILSTGPIFGSIDNGSNTRWAYTKNSGYIPDGDIHAIIVLDRALTADEKQQIVSHFSEGIISRPSTAENAFRNRTDLTALDTSYGDWTQVTNAGQAFANCSSLTTPPDVSGWTQVTDATYAFGDCSSLTTPPDVSGWTQVTDATYAFYNCSSLATPPDVSGWTQVTNAGQAFAVCSSLTTPPDVSGWTQVTDARQAFVNCSSLTTPPDVSGWTQVTEAGAAFANCSSLTTPPDVSGWTQVTEAGAAFANCSSLTTPPDVSGWTQVTDATYAFANCSVLASAIDLTSWNPTILTSADLMMYGVPAAGFDQAAYDAALISWDTNYDLSTVNAINIDFGSAQYTAGGAAEAARTQLINAGWSITDGGAA